MYQTRRVTQKGNIRKKKYRNPTVICSRAACNITGGYITALALWSESFIFPVFFCFAGDGDDGHGSCCCGSNSNSPLRLDSFATRARNEHEEEKRSFLIFLAPPIIVVVVVVVVVKLDFPAEWQSAEPKVVCSGRICCSSSSRTGYQTEELGRVVNGSNKEG
jgi:hypothetical protein